MLSESYTAEQRQLAQDLLTFYRNDPGRWTQHAHVRNSTGQITWLRDPDACQWCLVGALWEIAPAVAESVQVLNAALRLFADPYDRISIITWNDRSKRTFDDVVLFLRTVAG